MERLISFIGLLCFILIMYVFSSDRKRISWRLVLSGIGLQFFFALFILKTSVGNYLFSQLKIMFVKLISFANEGSSFVFGPLSDVSKTGFVFAIMIVGTIIFVSSLMSILYYLGIMQKVIKAFAFIMMRVMKTSGAESLATAANIFAGQTEAPLVVKPYIDKMTNSELLALMTGGMTTLAGGVLAAYVSFDI